jgi:hypothetical protein
VLTRCCVIAVSTARNERCRAADVKRTVRLVEDIWLLVNDVVHYRNFEGTVSFLAPLCNPQLKHADCWMPLTLVILWHQRLAKM